MWLIVTEEKIMGITLAPEQYYEHTLTGSEIDQLRIVNPSKLHALLHAWHAHAPLKTISIAFAGKGLIEHRGPPNTLHIPTGYITHTYFLDADQYTVSIPGALFLQYSCILHALGITLQRITTVTLLTQKTTDNLDSHELIKGCIQFNEAI